MLSLLISALDNCLLVLLCMLAHEFGHILVARYYHVPVKRLGIGWTGMYIQRARSSGWPEIATCLGGPAINLVLAVALWNVSHWFAVLSLVFALVNILPISHSDGSHALDAYRAMQQPAPIQIQQKAAQQSVRAA